jgi:cation transport protein ChaC
MKRPSPVSPRAEPAPAPAEPEAAETQAFWVFAYGSLMWQPGFPHIAVQPALLRGYHRSFCIYSHHYRGTPEMPGLVLGLARGGACRGLAFAVPPAEREAVIAYLQERELVSYAYQARLLRIELNGGPVAGYTFVADPAHPQYAGDLGIERAAEIIMGARGVAGLNRDYLINTISRLEEEGFRDNKLHTLLRKVEQLTGVIEAGGGI